MNVAIFAYSRQGCKTARRVMEFFAGDTLQCYTMARFDEAGFAPIERPAKPFYGRIFSKVDAMVFVGSVGIAVREIAPHVRDKSTDPAVVSIDELGKFCVPLLSGHIGGANALAIALGDNVGALTVITTATDINKRFSVDAWAAQNGYAIASLACAKAVSAAILEHDVPLCAEYPVTGTLPNGVYLGDTGDVGIYIGVRKNAPFTRTLRLIPPTLHLGIGCRRGTSAEQIRDAVEQMLRSNGIDRRAIKCVASIDLKSDEAGLLEFCDAWHLPVDFYSAERLRAVAGEFTPSEFVAQTTGVDNVCERAACIDAARLIVQKCACNGVTVALAEENREVHFG